MLLRKSTEALIREGVRGKGKWLEIGSLTWKNRNKRMNKR
jgi:hypothetical protein